MGGVVSSSSFVFATVIAGALVAPLAGGFHGTPTEWGCSDTWEGSLCTKTIFDEYAYLFVEAASETDDVYLSFNDSNVGAASLHRLEADAVSGAFEIIDAFATGQMTQTWEIPLRTPPGQDMFLNLSRNIGGKVFWSNTASQAGDTIGSGTDVTVVRVELLAGGKRVGGYEEIFSAGMQSGPWSWISLNMWPEIRVLDTRAMISLRVSRAGGLGDFLIGTGGSHQSFIDLRYSSFDPLAGALFLKNRKIVPYTGDTLEGPLGLAPEDGPVAGLSFLVLAPAARRRGRVGFIVLCLLLSGCAGQSGPAARPDPASTDALDPEAKVTIEDPSRLSGSRTGAVEGTVLDDLGFAVRGAYIAVLATNLFARADSTGAFAFEEVPPGEYVVRVDARGYQSVQRNFDVFAGKLTRINFTMQPTVAKEGFDRPHRHGDWGDEVALPLQDKTFDFTPCRPPPPSPDINFALALAVGAANAYVFDHRCEQRIPIDLDRPVPAGTGSLEVNLTWSPGSGVPQELGVRVVSPIPHVQTMDIGPARTGSFQFYLPRPAGESLRVAIYPNEADPGHQRFTNWQFWVQTPVFDVAQPFRTYSPNPFPVHVTITAHKGVVPYEPAHRDFWGGNTSIELLNEASVGPAADASSYNGATFFPGVYCWELDPASFVPPGTARLTGYLRWENSLGLSLTEWRVAFRAADVPTTTSVYRPAEMQGTGPNRTFVIEPLVKETDQFYQTRSYWRFCVDDEDETVNSGARTTWHFAVVAHRDPNYRDA